MFKLPVCPYCRTVYSYGEVRKNQKKKSLTCYHCNNKFIQSKAKGYIYLGILVAFIAVVINVIILNLTSGFVSSAIPIGTVSVCAVILGFILTPFFTSYKADKNTKICNIPSAEILNADGKTNKKLKRSVKNKLKKAEKRYTDTK